MSAPVILSAAATKGGVGKTTLIANVSAVLADIGLRVLMIDCDVQPSLSKYYPISHRAPNGIVELLLGENTEEIIRSTISNTVFPNLDIVISNNISAFVETEVTSRPDRTFLLKSKLHSQYIQNNYDVVLIDTQGAVGPLLDTAAFAATCLLCPIMPEVLSAREFLTGTQELLKRLQKGEAMRIPMPQLRAIIYAQDRTNDAKFIASSIKDFFSNTLDDRRKLLSVAVPAAKAYKEATTLRVPVHCHERKQLGKMLPAYEIMHRIVYEIFPGIEQKNLRGSCFNDMASLLQKEVQS
ncbi:cobyrinic acid a,c-diamide synthase [Neisseria gonorrhoeae]|uniref:ParA family protein n=1 Tax=Neisseria gonorrhoeae TaxID=485 RepID=UPI00049F4074|nr:ParA family protein [Neisseria gonorrhoeae]KDM99785.1 cobyrinic acid a,c-diamide synthase [Neisseria gonorrhoeae]